MLRRIHFFPVAGAFGLANVVLLTLLACSGVRPTPAAHGDGGSPVASAPALPAPVSSAAAPASAAATAPALEFLRFEHDAMYTGFSLLIPARPDSAQLAQEIFALVDRLDAQANEWKPESPLAAVSRGAGGPPVPVPPDVYALLEAGKQLGLQTDGAFDITWAALWGLWSFDAQRVRLPSQADISARLPRIDYRALELDPVARTARLSRSGMVLGVGGIVKGYALDRAAELLVSHGVRDFLLSAGGQYLFAGKKGDRPWRLGVRDPRGDLEDVLLTLEPPSGSLSTSGDYERFFEVEGVRYHHILDPRTGWPARGVRSVTVLAPYATQADALSTACMVRGLEGCARFAAALPGVGALLILEDGRVETVGSFPAIQWVHPPRVQ